jgi:prevent-host-death family protein
VKTVGSYEAKTHLPSLLEEVERGAEIVITRHGKAIARLVPVAERVDDRRLKAAVERLKRFRHGRRLGDATIKELINEGRS